MGWSDQADLYRSDDREVINSGQSKLLIEEPQTGTDGKVITLLTNKVPLRNMDGEVFGVLGTYMDVTERERAEEALRQSEVRFKAIFEHARDGIALADSETKRFLVANDCFCQMLGYTKDELTRLSIEAIHPADQLPMIAVTFERQARGEIDLGANLPVKRKDGTIFFADISSAPVLIGGKANLLGIFRDVTERERATEALKQSEVRFKAIFDHARDGIALADAKTKKLFAGNKSFCNLVGYTPEELPSLDIAAFHPPGQLPDIVRGFERQVRGEIDLTTEMPVIRKDGSIFYADISVSPVEVGGIQYLLGVFHDVSERKLADDKIKFANTLLQAEIESAPDGVFVVHSDPPALSFNRNFLDMWSIPPAVENSTDSDRLLAVLLQQLKEPAGLERDVGQLRDDPNAVVRFHEAELKDGRTVEYFGNVIKDEAGAALGRIWFFRDITERKRSADALAQSEARFKAIFDNARDGIALTDPETKKFLLGNAYLYRMLGYSAEEFAGLGMSDIHPTESMSAVLNEFDRHLRADKRAATDIPVKRKDGSILYVDINSALVEIGGRSCVLGIFRDATARREAEEAVRRSEERYRGLVESTTDYIWEIDENGRYTYYTPAIAELLGYERDEVMGKTPFDLMPPAEAKTGGRDIQARSRQRTGRFPCWKTRWSPKTAPKLSWKPAVFPSSTKTANSAVIAVLNAISPSASAPSNSSSSATRCCTPSRSARRICSRRLASTKRSRTRLAVVGRALHVDRVIVLERSPSAQTRTGPAICLACTRTQDVLWIAQLVREFVTDITRCCRLAKSL